MDTLGGTTQLPALHFNVAHGYLYSTVKYLPALFDETMYSPFPWEHNLYLVDDGPKSHVRL
jgi:hypothetical protein